MQPLIVQYGEKLKPKLEKAFGFELKTRDETHFLVPHGYVRFIRTERLPSNTIFKGVK